MLHEHFRPQWASPLGDTLSSLMSRADITLVDLASRTNMTVRELQAVMSGISSVEPTLAKMLSTTVGGSVDFWLSRDREFRSIVERLPLDQRINEAWVKAFPYSDMVRLGWVPSTSKNSERAKHLLEFFGIACSAQWKHRYPESRIAGAFKTSYSFEPRPAAVSAWLRKGEKASENINCASWDAKRFAKHILGARSLTKNKRPRRFFPLLQSLCADCGVALVAVPTPRGCPVSGATQFLTKDKALMMLSFRFRTDDQFWFTFFHESGHLIHQDVDTIFIDDQYTAQDSNEELEANAFAQDILIPSTFQSEMHNLQPTSRNVIRFALKLGISPGIVVGQLQRAGIISHRTLNSLKRRYPDEEIYSIFST